MSRLLRLVISVCALLLVAAPAALADCGTAPISDYTDDGVIQGHYSQACYARALKEVPPDASSYSDLVPALQAAAARDRLRATGSGGGAPPQQAPPRSVAAVAPTRPPATSTTSKAKASRPKRRSKAAASTSTATTVDPTAVTTQATHGAFSQAIGAVGPRHADEVPLPVIVLGILALLLIASGAGGMVAQRLARRRAAED